MKTTKNGKKVSKGFKQFAATISLYTTRRFSERIGEACQQVVEIYSDKKKTDLIKQVRQFLCHVEWGNRRENRLGFHRRTELGQEWRREHTPLLYHYPAILKTLQELGYIQFHGYKKGEHDGLWSISDKVLLEERLKMCLSGNRAEAVSGKIIDSRSEAYIRKGYLGKRGSMAKDPKLPLATRQAIGATKYVHFNLKALQECVDIEEANKYHFAENDRKCLHDILSHLPEQIEGDIQRIVLSHQVLSTGRLSELGFQSATGIFKEFAFYGVGGINYDLKAAQAVFFLKLVKEAGLNQRQELKEGYEYLVNFWTQDGFAKTRAEAIGLTKVEYKQGFYGLIMGASTSTHKGENEHTRVYESMGCNKEKFKSLVSELAPLKQLIDAYHSYLDTLPGELVNALGLKLNPLDEEGKPVRAGVKMAHLLQGLEAYYVQTLTYLGQKYRYQVLSNQHDGFYCLGEVSDAAVIEANRICGFKDIYPKLEIKPFHEEVHAALNEHGLEETLQRLKNGHLPLLGRYEDLISKQQDTVAYLEQVGAEVKDVTAGIIKFRYLYKTYYYCVSSGKWATWKRTTWYAPLSVHDLTQKFKNDAETPIYTVDEVLKYRPHLSNFRNGLTEMMKWHSGKSKHYILSMVDHEWQICRLIPDDAEIIDLDDYWPMAA